VSASSVRGAMRPAKAAVHSVAIHPPYPLLRKICFTLARGALANLARLNQNQPGGRGDGCNLFVAGAYAGPDRCTAAEERRRLMLNVTLMLRVDCL